jgi:DnaK suppressor protein
MTKTEVDVFRRILESRRTELGEGNRNRQGLTIETSADELDRIQHAAERDFAMGSLQRNSNVLREVRSALCRINAGTFGVCAGCEENINPKRLAAIPWASFCLRCQEAADREEQTSGSQIETSLAMVS